MIRYALMCACGAAFDAWYASAETFDTLKGEGLLECPTCGGADVDKQIMAPAIAGRAGPPDAAARFEALAARMRAHIAETHDYVGERFASEARAMHEGEKDHRPIYGEATPEEAKALRDEGAPVAPLPAAFVPDAKKKLN